MGDQMHSSGLRGTDFQLTRDGSPVPHSEFFADVTDTDRLGIFTPRGAEGLGAALLILAHVTAFYDRYRARDEDFFAYPDYFTFQRRSPCVAYRSLDVWPAHKNVAVNGSYGETLAAITDRSVSILAVPGRPLDRQRSAGPAREAKTEIEEEANFDRLRLASARRNIRRCYLYDPSGRISGGAVQITCTSPDAAVWIASTARAAEIEFDRVSSQWYREVTLDEALESLH